MSESTGQSNRHTPGPWKFSPYGEIQSETHACTSIAEVPLLKWAHSQVKADRDGNQDAAKWCGECYAECEANARLIAAAPDLLAACRDADEWLTAYVDGAGQEWEDMRASLRAAIAKVKGGAA